MLCCCMCDLFINKLLLRTFIAPRAALLYESEDARFHLAGNAVGCGAGAGCGGAPLAEIVGGT